MNRTILLTVLSCIVLLKEGDANCNHTTFEETWSKKHGSVIWANTEDDTVPGVVRCQEGFVFDGDKDLVYCKDNSFVMLDLDAGCIEDPFVKTKLVEFQGQTYNYTQIDVGKKTFHFPVKNPNITYVVTTNYTASKTTPTIRVHVGLVGKSHHPVLINIQQSTESVGFELPMKVVGKGTAELAPLNEKTVELCPKKLDVDKKDVPIPEPETVKVVLTGGGATNPNDKGNGPYVIVRVSSVQHMELEPDKPQGPTNIAETETLVYRYMWPKDGSVEEVDILVSHFTGDKNHKAGTGGDVCAQMSIRSGKCPLEEMGISDLTFTRQAFVTVNRHDKRLKDIKDGFLVVINVMLDDYMCRSDPGATESPTRSKAIKIQLTKRGVSLPFIYLAIPISTCFLLVAFTGLILFIFIRPLKSLGYGSDEDIVDVSDTGALIIRAVDPPFEPQIAEIDPMMENVKLRVDLEDRNDNFGNMDSVSSPDDNDEMVPDLMNKSFTLSELFKRVKTNETVVNITQTIGHCSVPLLIFLNSFDSAYKDIQGNLKELTLDGNLDACYVNSRCAFPTNISGYRIPDISRVTSNLPYLISGVCFYILVQQKWQIMKPINALGKGVKHDFALFNAIAFITGLIGLTSAIYHVCPNQTTSRIDMYFIQILLGYYSLKLYQSRVPDIREVYYAPVIIICVLSAVERVMGETRFAWDIIGSVHLLCTLLVTVQLFFMGKVTMNPFTMYQERHNIKKKILESRKQPEFKFQAGFFLLGVGATAIIAITAWMGKWQEVAMYNVFALSSDIVIYLVYYILTKAVVRKEKMKTRVVVMVAASFITWATAFIFFFAYRSINTSASPAESRCLNKACIGGFLDGHDLWHCLSALAIFLTNNMILLIDDDLIDARTEDTYF